MTPLQNKIEEAKKREEVEDLLSGELDVLENAISDENRELAICARELIDRLATLAQEEAVEKIKLILPMAKGYAHEHPVGSNQKYIEDVETFLSTLSNNTLQ